jgi:predicted AlkP superfamily phosphohydrolase/phosphomutase
MAIRKKNRILMIGLDAAEFSFIASNRSSLPNFQRFLDTGTTFRLESTAEILTGSVWPTFYTGNPPDYHGIYHHLQWDPYCMCLRRVSADWLYCEPFWYELERRGLKVAILDVPMTFPSRLERGIEVINWGSHDKLGPFASQPAELGKDICRNFGRHPMGYERPVKKKFSQLAKVRRNLVEGARRKGMLSQWLLGLGECDFFLTVFGETHRGGHILWPEAGMNGNGAFDSLLEVYRAVDEGIGMILDAIVDKETDVILFSLHGMGENTSQEHFVPKIMDAINTGFFLAQTHSKRSVKIGVTAKQRSLMRHLREKLPVGLQNAIARAVPIRLRDSVANRQVTAGHNWERTPALGLLADLNGYLRFNLKGRERRGILEEDSELFAQYEAWLRRSLMELRIVGNCEPLVSEIRFARETFSGPRSGHLPDVIITWTNKKLATRVSSKRLGQIYAESRTGRGGNHRPDGFCILLKQGRRRWDEFKATNIGDLRVMILQRFGVYSGGSLECF